MVTLRDTIQWVARAPKSVLIGRIDSVALVPSALPQFLLVTESVLERLVSGALSAKPFKAVLITKEHSAALAWDSLEVPVGILNEGLSHLEHLDVLRIEDSTNRLRVMYKRAFRHNSLLITERCNNHCVMCSQPPRDVDDSWIVEELFRVIELIPKDTPEITITGGEPTLLGERLLQLIRAVKHQLPITALHILSNGRRFSDPEFARQCGAIAHPDLVIGIPIYSDNYIDHDYVVQGKGGFDEAVRGIYNLKRHGVKVEIRCVIHRGTYSRLDKLAVFISRNLTFVDHVALMGYEAMGFGKTNAKHLFVLPEVFIAKLNTAIQVLRFARISTSVYNLPLCLLRGPAAQLAVQSISDWKNEYLPECEGCIEKAHCTGFFASTKGLYEGQVVPKKAVQLAS